MAFANISVAEPARFVGACTFTNELQWQLNELGVVRQGAAAGNKSCVYARPSACYEMIVVL
jgi:hypothetical protein